MQTNIYCENEECTYCADGICEKTAVKVNYRGRCESAKIKDPASQTGGINETKTV